MSKRIKDGGINSAGSKANPGQFATGIKSEATTSLRQDYASRLEQIDPLITESHAREREAYERYVQALVPAAAVAIEELHRRSVAAGSADEIILAEGSDGSTLALPSEAGGEVDLHQIDDIPFDTVRALNDSRAGLLAELPGDPGEPKRFRVNPALPPRAGDALEQEYSVAREQAYPAEYAWVDAADESAELNLKAAALSAMTQDPDLERLTFQVDTRDAQAQVVQVKDAGGFSTLGSTGREAFETVEAYLENASIESLERLSQEVDDVGLYNAARAVGHDNSFVQYELSLKDLVGNY